MFTHVHICTEVHTQSHVQLNPYNTHLYTEHMPNKHMCISTKPSKVGMVTQALGVWGREFKTNLGYLANSKTHKCTTERMAVLGVEERAQWLRLLTALAQGPGSSPSAHRGYQLPVMPAPENVTLWPPQALSPLVLSILFKLHLYVHVCMCVPWCAHESQRTLLGVGSLLSLCEPEDKTEVSGLLPTKTVHRCLG